MHISPLQILALASVLAAGDLVAQDTIANYPFTSGSRRSVDTDAKSSAGYIGFGNYVSSYNGKIKLGGSWKASRQGDSNYAKNTIYVRITPLNGAKLDIDSVSLQLTRDDTSVVRSIDVRADEDPRSTAGNNFKTLLKSVNLPDTTRKFSTVTTKIDLSGVKLLQGNSKTVTLRLHLWGKNKTGPCPSYLDNVIVKGSATGGCTPARLRNVGYSYCSPGGVLWLDRLPAFGTTPTVTLRTGSPKAIVYFYASIGTVKPWILPTTRCKIYLDPKTAFRLHKVTLDSNGRTSFKLPIHSAYKGSLNGAKFGMQALIWTTKGDGLSNAIELTLGCK